MIPEKQHLFNEKTKKVCDYLFGTHKPFCYRLLTSNRRFLTFLSVTMFVRTVLMVIITTMVVVIILLAVLLILVLLTVLVVGMTVMMILRPVITVQDSNHWNDHWLPARPIKEQLLQPADDCPVQDPLINYLVILEGVQNCPEDLMVSCLDQFL